MIIHSMFDIINNPFKLSDEQAKPIASHSKQIKILAGAGAGKTEVLTRKILNLLLNEHAEPESIVAFTFTDKAANEMKIRIRQTIQEIDPEYKTANFSKMYVGTIHSFCLELLENYFGYGIYNVIDPNQEMAYILRRGYRYGLSRGVSTYYSDACIKFQNSLEVFYNEDISRGAISEINPDFLVRLEKYEEDMDRDRIISFSRLIYLAVQHLKIEPQKISHIKYLLVDEYQDINKIQFELINLIGNKESVFVVGDPRQSIYEWRGSNYKYFEDFNDYFVDTEEFTLKENRRSLEDIVKVSNDIVKNLSTSYPDMISTREGSGIAARFEYKNADDEAYSIANKILTEVQTNNKNYSDFAVLFRSIKSSGDMLLNRFKELSIPYIVNGNTGLFKRNEVVALAQIFCWFDKDGFWGYGKNSLKGDDLLNIAINNWTESVNKGEVNKNELIKLSENLEHYGEYREIYQKVLILLHFNELDQNDPLENIIMANTGRFTRILSDFEKSYRYRGGKKKIKSEMHNLCWFINTYANSSYDAANIEDFGQYNAVVVSTIHQAKGLEWPVVFVPSMIKGKFPSLNHRGKALMIDNSLYDYVRYKTNVESEYRLFYVAITRAKDYCLMSSFNRSNSDSRTNISPFIEDVKQLDNIEDIDIRPFSSTSSQHSMPSIAVTNLVDYSRCPYHYKLSAEWGYAQGVDPFMGYGKALHHVLRCLSEDMVRGKEIDRRHIKNLIEEQFYLPFASDEFMLDIKNDINKKMNIIYDNYLKYDDITHIESKVEATIGDVILEGKMDLVANKDGTRELRDYKSSENVVTREEAEMQLVLYAHGLTLQGEKIDKLFIISIKDAKKIPVPLDQTTINKNVTNAKKLIDSINAKDFNGKKSSFCRICEYKDICRYK